MVLHDASSLALVFKLIDKGLSGEQIDRAMRQMVGNDWRELNVSVWLKRLKNQEYVLHNDHELSAHDLEALIKGRIKLDDLSKRRRD